MIATVASLIADGMRTRWPIKVLPFPFPHQTVGLYAYWHPSRDNDAALDAFMKIVRNVLAKPKAKVKTVARQRSTD